MSWDSIRTVGIIGAGVSGIATAKTLLSEGFDCTVFERRSELGGVWADGYLNFGVQVQKELYEFPDWPLPPETPDFTPGPVFQKYLSDYCDEFGVRSRTRFDTRVTGLSPRDGDRPGWVLTLNDGTHDSEAEFDLVVICIGTFSSQPNIPQFPGQEKFQGVVIHNSELKSPDQIAGKRVLVVGYGKSATDSALEAAKVASQTSILFRTPRWPIPQKLAGVLPFKWGLLQRMASTLLPLYQQPSGLELVLHSVGAPLVWLYWRLTELLLYFQCRLGNASGTRTSLVPPMPIELSGFDHTTMVPRPDFYRLVREGVINACRSGIESFTERGITLENGEQLDADVVVLATGWRTDYSFLGEDQLEKLNIEDDGYYLYRHMINPNLPNLVFLGCNAVTYEAIVTFNLQARWLAELIKDRHRLPERDVMIRNIEEMKRWKRSWILPSPGRGAMIGPHQIHYHDELLRDFGANPKRKKGLFAPLLELIGPYESRDYATIVSGAWEQEETRLN